MDKLPPSNILDDRGDTQLNYFVFETHVRKMIRDLIEPTSQKQADDREIVNEAKRLLANVSKRLSELEYIIYKGNDRNTIFDEIFNKINQQDIETKQFKEMHKEEMVFVQSRHSHLELRLGALEESQKTVAEQMRGFQHDLERFYEILHDDKKELGQQTLDNKQKFDREVSSINQAIIRIQATLKISQHEFESASTKITQHDKDIDNHRLQLNTITKDLFETKEIKLNKADFTKDTKKIEEQFQQVNYALGDLHNNIKTSDNYIEKYQPIKFLQLQIESLSTILEKKQLKKLQEFEQKKYKQLHSLILTDTGIPNKNLKQNYIENQSKGKISYFEMKANERESNKTKMLAQILDNQESQQIVRIETNNVDEDRVMQSFQNHPASTLVLPPSETHKSESEQSFYTQNKHTSHHTPSRHQSANFQPYVNAQIPGGLISIGDLDPELSNLIKGFSSDMEDFKKEFDSIRQVINYVKGISRDEIFKEFKKVRDEQKAGCRELLRYCQQVQEEIEEDNNNNKKQRLQDNLEFDNLREGFIKLNNFCQESLQKSVQNLKDLTLILVENAMISQATEKQKHFQEQQLIAKKQSDYEIIMPGQHLIDTQRTTVNHQQLPLQNYELNAASTSQTGLPTQPDYIGVHNYGSARRLEIKTSQQQHRKLMSSSQLQISGKSSHQIPRAETPHLQSQNLFSNKRRINTPGLFSGYNSNSSSSANLHMATTNANSNQSLYKEGPNFIDTQPVLYRNRLFKKEHLTMIKGYLLQKATSNNHFTKSNQVESIGISEQVFKQAMKDLGIVPIQLKMKSQQSRLEEANLQLPSNVTPSNFNEKQQISPIQNPAYIEFLKIGDEKEYQHLKMN